MNTPCEGHFWCSCTPCDDARRAEIQRKAAELLGSARWMEPWELPAAGLYVGRSAPAATVRPPALTATVRHARLG